MRRIGNERWRRHSTSPRLPTLPRGLRLDPPEAQHRLKPTRRGRPSDLLPASRVIRNRPTIIRPNWVLPRSEPPQRTRLNNNNRQSDSSVPTLPISDHHHELPVCQTQSTVVTLTHNGHMCLPTHKLLTSLDQAHPVYYNNTVLPCNTSWKTKPSKLNLKISFSPTLRASIPIPTIPRNPTNSNDQNGPNRPNFGRRSRGKRQGTRMNYSDRSSQSRWKSCLKSKYPSLGLGAVVRIGQVGMESQERRNWNMPGGWDSRIQRVRVVRTTTCCRLGDIDVVWGLRGVYEVTT